MISFPETGPEIDITLSNGVVIKSYGNIDAILIALGAETPAPPLQPPVYLPQPPDAPMRPTFGAPPVN